MQINTSEIRHGDSVVGRALALEFVVLRASAQNMVTSIAKPVRSKERAGVGPAFRSSVLGFVARMERSEIRGGRAAGLSLPDYAALHPGYEEIEGSGTPANAGYHRRIWRCGARSTERARLTAFHRGSHLRELFHPKGSASGQASWDAVCTGVTRLRLSQSRDAPPTPVVMPGDMMPKPPGSRLQTHPRAPPSLP